MFDLLLLFSLWDQFEVLFIVVVVFVYSFLFVVLLLLLFLLFGGGGRCQLNRNVFLHTCRVCMF